MATTAGCKDIRIVALLGSAREGNYTARALRLAVDEAASRGVTVRVIDPAELDLAVPGKAGNAEQVAALQAAVGEATGVIFATPEYHGSFSSTTKLLIDSLGFPSKLAGKPVALLGVAAGGIGAIKALEHLRSVCSHVGALVLPGPVSVAGVQGHFDDAGRCLDPVVEANVRQVAHNLLDYIERHICPARALEELAREGRG